MLSNLKCVDLTFFAITDPVITQSMRQPEYLFHTVDDIIQSYNNHGLMRRLLHQFDVIDYIKRFEVEINYMCHKAIYAVTIILTEPQEVTLQVKEIDVA